MTATLLYAYKKDDNAVYIHYPHFTQKVNVEVGAGDEKFVVFEDEFALNEFMGYLEDHNLDTSELNTYSSGETWDSNALALKELL